jgi:hypothetical protein
MVAICTSRFLHSETHTKQEDCGNNATDEDDGGSDSTDFSSVLELPTGIAPTTTTTMTFETRPVLALVASSKAGDV